MVICSCRAVNDRTVHAVIDDGATTVQDVAARCGAGTDCGGCWPELEHLLAEHRAGRRLHGASV